MSDVQLGVLDQSPIPDGSSASDALANSIDLAKRTEALGYSRYWVAEHHDMEGLAGSAPEVLIAAIAAATERIRVGSGGVMLTHYSPYKVAEQFRVLEALHPGRIDLGIGRAPGSNHRTAAVLARGGTPLDIEFYPQQIDELLQHLHDSVPTDSPIAGVRARPLGPGTPQVAVLASSIDSASFAAHFGLPLAWAQFIAPQDGSAMTAAYRAQYQPSAGHPEPQVILAVAAICAATDEAAERVASSVRSWRRRGLTGGVPSIADAVAVSESRPNLLPGKPILAGSPERVRDGLDELAEHYGADELMVVTICHDHNDRITSYELIADAYDLAPVD